MKLLSAEIDLGSATNLSNHPLVRVYNSDSSAVTLTRKNNVGTVIGSYSIPAGKVIYSEKAYTDTLEGGAALKATAVGYSEMMEIIALGGGDSFVTSNLLLHLDGSTSSPSDSTWTDGSSNGHNGTINGATYSSDNSGVWGFDGNDKVTFSSLSLPNRPFTINCFHEYTNMTGWQMIAGQDSSDSSGPGSFYFGKANSGNTGSSRASNSFGSTIRPNGTSDQVHCNSPSAISINTWYNHCLVASTTDLKLYQNNTLVTTVSNSDTIATRTGTFALGGAWYDDNFGDYFKGNIGVFSIYDVDLTTSQITQNFDAFKTRYGLS